MGVFRKHLGASSLKLRQNVAQISGTFWVVFLGCLENNLETNEL